MYATFAAKSSDRDMNIVFVGSGNTAVVLARLCKQKGHTILQFLSRHPERAAQAAAEYNCSSGSLSEIPDGKYFSSDFR
jgi:predicted dehydrogenase